MSKSAVIHARIDAELKHSVEKVLEHIGLSASEAIRLFYRQIEIHQGIPFELRVPNELTSDILDKSERGKDVYQAKDAEDLFNQLGI